MDQEQKNNGKRKREELFFKTDENNEKEDQNNYKRRKLEDSADENHKHLDKYIKMIDSVEDFPWEDLFNEKLEDISSVIEILKSGGFFFDTNDFYEVFSYSEDEKIKDKLDIFIRIDVDINWVRLLNIFIRDNKDDCVILLKNKITNEINNFTIMYVFNEGYFSFLPGLWTNLSFIRAFSPLFVAICNENINQVKLLVECFDADVNAKQLSLDSIGAEYESIFTGMSPLHLAIELGSYDIIEYLISKGADINCSDNNGNTILHTTNCKKDLVGFSLWLLENGADANKVNKVGKTPLDILIDNKIYNLKLIYKLILNGEKNKDGKILIPDSIKKHSNERFIFFLYKVMELFPSVYSDGKKPENILLQLICYVESYIRSIFKVTNDKLTQNNNNFKNYYYPMLNNYLNFMVLIVKDFINDCEKNKVSFDELKSKNGVNVIHVNKILYILVYLSSKNYYIDDNKTKALLTDYIKTMISLFLCNDESIVNELDLNKKTILHFSCAGFDEVSIDEITGAELYSGITRDLLEKFEVNDINCRDYKGRTPLCYAVLFGKKSSIKALIDNGASLDNLDGKGTNFYELLKKSDNGLDVYFENIRKSQAEFEKIKINALNRRVPYLEKIHPTDSCLICMDDFGANLKQLFLVSCGHGFCERCIKKEFVSNDGDFKVCPTCRCKPLEIEFDSEKLRAYILKFEKNK
jgi:ankyrin repeat protein